MSRCEWSVTGRLTGLGRKAGYIVSDVAEKQRIAEQDFGVRVGSIVKDKKGVEYKVTKVDTRLSGKPWIEGNPKKKDGTFGIALRNVYGDWELLK